ncbi:hypothetical protein BC936DRAFT_137214 [Jimgerdemannia flammicorona]|uniref:Spt5 KOW domain-containing protein n=1 Tax=Jimgerdemannia flammicorona TaxID=994334 RepID=A0A433CXV9_9FUNG|nr:hypothetical protein BC936DRAFT_137214 [Jimgerdemannia flammicorona]
MDGAPKKTTMGGPGRVGRLDLIRRRPLVVPRRLGTPAPHTLSAPTPYDSAPTPAASSLVPATPAPNTAPTPAPQHLTAHAVAPTPGPMSAPTPGPLSAPTPGHFFPSTPGAMHFPQTPFVSGGGEYSVVEERANEVEDWPMHDIEVRVIRHRRTGTSYQGGAHDGHTGQVLRVDNSRRTCRVQLLGGQLSVLESIGWDYLEPVRPGKKENVKVITGEFRGQLGQLFGTDNHDGIVKLKEASEFKIMGMVHLAKYVGDEEV